MIIITQPSSTSMRELSSSSSGYSKKSSGRPACRATSCTSSLVGFIKLTQLPFSPNASVSNNVSPILLYTFNIAFYPISSIYRQAFTRAVFSLNVKTKIYNISVAYQIIFPLQAGQALFLYFLHASQGVQVLVLYHFRPNETSFYVRMYFSGRLFGG